MSKDSAGADGASPVREGLVSQGEKERIVADTVTNTLTETDAGVMTVRGDPTGFAQEIRSGNHRLSADEPIEIGGNAENGEGLRRRSRR